MKIINALIIQLFHLLEVMAQELIYGQRLKKLLMHLLNIVITINEKLIGLKYMLVMKLVIFMELIIISLMTQLKQLDIMAWL